MSPLTLSLFDFLTPASVGTNHRCKFSQDNLREINDKKHRIYDGIFFIKREQQWGRPHVSAIIAAAESLHLDSRRNVPLSKFFRLFVEVASVDRIQQDNLRVDDNSFIETRPQQYFQFFVVSIPRFQYNDNVSTTFLAEYIARQTGNYCRIAYCHAILSACMYRLSVNMHLVITCALRTTARARITDLTKTLRPEPANISIFHGRRMVFD